MTGSGLYFGAKKMASPWAGGRTSRTLLGCRDVVNQLGPLPKPELVQHLAQWVRHEIVERPLKPGREPPQQVREGSFGKGELVTLAVEVPPLARQDWAGLLGPAT